MTAGSCLSDAVSLLFFIISLLYCKGMLEVFGKVSYNMLEKAPKKASEYENHSRKSAATSFKNAERFRNKTYRRQDQRDVI